MGDRAQSSPLARVVCIDLKEDQSFKINNVFAVAAFSSYITSFNCFLDIIGISNNDDTSTTAILFPLDYLPQFLKSSTSLCVITTFFFPGPSFVTGNTFVGLLLLLFLEGLTFFSNGTTFV